MAILHHTGVIALLMSDLPFYTDLTRYPDTYLSSPLLPVILSLLIGYIVASVFFDVSCLFCLFMQPHHRRSCSFPQGPHRRLCGKVYAPMPIYSLHSSQYQPQQTELVYMFCNRHITSVRY